MPKPSWPVGVPYLPERDSYQIAEPYQPPISTSMEDGPNRMRRRSVTTISRVQMTIVMTDAQFQTFKAWVRDTLSHGASQFTMPVWSPGADVDALPSRYCSLDGGTYTAVVSMGLEHMLVTFSLRIRDY